MRTIWRKNFDILRTDYNIAGETMPGFGGLNFLTVGKNVITKAIWVNENGDNIGTYFDKQELREIASLTVDTVVNRPERIWQVHKKAIELNKRYFDFAEKVRKMNIGDMTNKRLVKIHRDLFNWQYLSHCTALPTTWWADSDNEDLSKYCLNLIEQKVKVASLKLNPSEVFSLLTTPDKESYAFTEEKESLKILFEIKKDKGSVLWFKKCPLEKLEAQLNMLPEKLRSQILRHHYRWCWTPYTYMGPAYGVDYYLQVWQGLLKEELDPSNEAERKQKLAADTQQKRKVLIGQLNLTKKEKDIFDIAADIVWLKNYRKDCYFHGFYVLDLLLAEVGRRSGLSLKQTKFLLADEVSLVLKGKEMAEELNERIKFSVLYGKYTPALYSQIKNKWSRKGITIFTGGKAKAFLKKQKFEKVKIVKSNELTGTCACPGKASGVVRVINVPEEMGKMNQGDIMLAHTTFPSLVPAMKKAAAIVTEDGGITCHAAIVAREMQIPCIVGCKNALKIFNDGDVVAVDASLGLIKKK